MRPASPAKTRRGTTFLETLLAMALVLGVVGVAVGGAWLWSRTRNRTARQQALLAGAVDRLERVLALPEGERPLPGRWVREAAPPALAEVLAPVALPGGAAAVELQVEPFPVEYTDPFFAGGDRLRSDDLRLLRLRVATDEGSLELVGLR